MPVKHRSVLKVIRPAVAVIAALVPMALDATVARGQGEECSPGWVQGIGTPGTSQVRALAVLAGGDLIVGGRFGPPARYNPNTGVWSTLWSGDGIGGVFALAVLPGGDLIVGGDFYEAAGGPANYVARVNPATGVWSALGSGVDDPVFSLAVLPGGDLIVGGDFTRVEGNNLGAKIARYNPATNVWSSVGWGVSGGDVFALAVLPNGDVVAGGNFTTAGNVPVNSIACYHPITDTWSALGSGITGTPGGPDGSIFYVWSLAVLPDGDVIAGGRFTIAGGMPANRIARCNPASGVWSAVGSGTSGAPGFAADVFSLALIPNGEIVVGGAFQIAGGVPANRVALYDLTTGIWSALGSGLDTRSTALAVLRGGDIIVGGDFTTAGGMEANGIARYTLGRPSILTQPSPHYTCGTGTTTFAVDVGGVGPFTYQWQWRPPNGQFVNVIDGRNADPEGGPLAFTAEGARTDTVQLEPDRGPGTGNSRWENRCVITNECGSSTTDNVTLTDCRADFNCDDFVDFFDLDAYVLAFETGVGNGDFNGDGFVDFFDLDGFVEAFEAGC